MTFGHANDFQPMASLLTVLNVLGIWSQSMLLMKIEIKNPTGSLDQFFPLLYY